MNIGLAYGSGTSIGALIGALYLSINNGVIYYPHFLAQLFTAKERSESHEQS